MIWRWAAALIMISGLLMDLVDGSFNYHVHGRDGFAALCRLVDGVDCYRFSYGRLEDAVRLFDRWG